jgi:hypothetical protein
MTPDRGRQCSDPELDGFRARLRDALRLAAQRSGVRLTPTLLRDALDEPAPSRRIWRWPMAAVGTAAVVALVVLTMHSLPVKNDASQDGSATGRSSLSAFPSLTQTASPAPVTLADCQVYPEDASLAFSGWATTDVLRVSGGSAEPGQPVYALVTRGLAEWMGWRSPDAGPIFPAPVGRMGCIFDPSTGGVSLVGVPMDWEPPAMIDGCPASPEDEFAGYREIGGPRAWALLPTGPSGWDAGQRAVILYRLSPPLSAGETVSAWAVPLDGGSRVDGVMGNELAPVASSGPLATPGQAEFRYYVVQQLLPSSGCWVLNLEVNGRLAGSAITSVAPPR